MNVIGRTDQRYCKCALILITTNTLSCRLRIIWRYLLSINLIYTDTYFIIKKKDF